MIKADFHIHTQYSMDCTTPLEKIIDRCEALGINCVAIADHDAVEGALRLKEIAPFKVIIAEEILTDHGEVMGLFLKERIPSGYSVEQTIAAIKEQGGLINIPHPFDKIRSSALGKHIHAIASEIDVVEVFNARSPLLRTSNMAREFAEKHGLAGSAGSDAHTLGEIGNATVTMPDFSGKEDFIDALRQGVIDGHRTNPLRHLNSTFAKLKNLGRGV
ncbi:PHP domain-containing protein [Chloroflexota bacterium]